MRPQNRDDDIEVGDGEDTLLEAFMARVPVAVGALSRIPWCGEFLRLIFGRPTSYWNLDNSSDLTTKMLCAGLQLEVEALGARLAAIEQKLEVACAAERAWRPMLQARASVVFHNDAGGVATMPVDLVTLIASRRTFDGDVVEKAKTVQFRTAGKVIAEIPKTLFVSLEKILETSQWKSRKT